MVRHLTLDVEIKDMMASDDDKKMCEIADLPYPKVVKFDL